MELTQQVRDYARQKGVEEAAAVAVGMEEKVAGVQAPAGDLRLGQRIVGDWIGQIVTSHVFP